MCTVQVGRGGAGHGTVKLCCARRRHRGPGIVGFHDDRMGCGRCIHQRGGDSRELSAWGHLWLWPTDNWMLRLCGPWAGRQVLAGMVGPLSGTPGEVVVSPLGCHLSAVPAGYILRPVGTLRQWSVAPPRLSGHELDVIGFKCHRIAHGVWRQPAD